MRPSLALLRTTTFRLALVQAGIVLAFWLPRFFSGREPASSALMIGIGMLAFTLVPGMSDVIDPRAAPKIHSLLHHLPD